MKKVFAADRAWGSEYIIQLVPGFYSVKILHILRGFMGGLQFHRLKHECGVVLSGELLVRYVSNKEERREIVLTRGDFFEFPPGLVHQEEALTDVVIFECSTPHFNDRVRLDTVDNAKCPLRTTELKEIISVSSDSYYEQLIDQGFKLVDASKLPKDVSLVTTHDHA